MNETLTARVVQHVLTNAKDGNFLPSELLPSERELAGTLSVSRNTITAAYAELERRGLIRRIHGKGAYLCALPAKEEESFSWSGKISRFANALDEPILENLARDYHEEIPFPFAVGTPSLEIFPKEAYSQCVKTVLDKDIPAALAVAPTEGQRRLRFAVANWLRVPAQHVMITTGAQEGIDLMARCLIEPGDYVVVDSPTYPGALQSFLSAGARLLSWGTEWSLGQLEELLLRYRPKLIFTMPTFQNPTGRVMSLKTRMGLLQLARRYRTPILEDDVYRETYFGDHVMPSSLFRLDKHLQVVNISTFSKILAPGLRIGWLVGPRFMLKQLALIKMRSNLFTGGFNQLVLAEMIQGGFLDKHLEVLRSHHRELGELAVGILEDCVRKGLLRFRKPGGGLYLWCRVPAPLDAEELLAILETAGIAVVSGRAFEPDREKELTTHFRLCFTAVNQTVLVEGLKRFVAILEAASGKREVT